MNNSDHLLQRLFRAASQAPVGVPQPLSEKVKSGVLNSWRRLESEDEISGLLALFRRAVLCAGVVMLLSIGWGWIVDSRENAGQTALANFAMKVQLSP